ncbi:MAG: hypothetical protein QG597_486 [Actinomycetota bacterium]|nr:hypothetical protein [Actinomycetota bacterium]
MSAFIVDPEHIHVLLSAGLRYRYYQMPLSWCWDNPTRQGQLTVETVDQVGDMLTEANIASVNHRYGEDNPLGGYRYQSPRQAGWSIGELLHALDCYEHQSCERDDWQSTEAHAFCQALRTQLITALPGYDSGPWSITARSVPAAVAAPVVTAQQAAVWAGRPLTPADLDRLATAIPHSTIPETVGAIVDSTTP